MDCVFTVYFEGPFWVGVLERDDGGCLLVARHVFGSEPTNAELLAFMLDGFAKMPRRKAAGTSCGTGLPAALPPRNAKRALREARREALRPPSTKARAALSSAHEASKEASDSAHREARDAVAARRFELRACKRKSKHQGH